MTGPDQAAPPRRRRAPRWPAGAAVLAVLVPAVAHAAPLGITSARLGAAQVAPPAFHATALAVTSSGGNRHDVHSPSQDDEIVLQLSQPVAPASVCAGWSTAAPQTLSGVTVDLVDGGAGPDSLQVSAGPASCPAPRLAGFVLGSGAYASDTVRFRGSSIVLAHGADATSTLTLRLGRPSRRVTPIEVPTVVEAVPDPALRDTSGRPVSAGTTVTVERVQF